MAIKKSIELRNLAAEELRKARAISEGKKEGERITEAEAKTMRDHMDEHDRLMVQAGTEERMETAEQKHRVPAGRLNAFPAGPGDEEGEGEGAPPAEPQVKGVTYDSKGQPRFPAGPFTCLGDQLMAVKNHYVDHKTDEKLYKVKALGSNEEVLSEGGFLVQPQFAYELFSKGYANSELANRCRKLTVGPTSNGVSILTVDETSRVTGSRWGGLQHYWVAPGTAVTATKPKFGSIDMRLKKMMVVWYATDEMLSDVATLNSFGSQAIPEEMAFGVTEAIFAGTGAGQPLGIKNAGCLVVVDKEGAQVADTVVAANVSKMWSRCWAPARKDAIWLINQDVEPQLDLLAVTVGLGGYPVYMPPGGLADMPYGRLKGRPVIIIEQAETVGDQGDITLAGMQQYVLEDKGGVQSDMSIHVAFLTDEACFRFTYRCDGSPTWKAALTPNKGSNTLSPFVQLAVRA